MCWQQVASRLSRAQSAELGTVPSALMRHRGLHAGFCRGCWEQGRRRPPAAGGVFWKMVRVRAGTAQGCATRVQVPVFLLLDFALQAGKERLKRGQPLKSGAEKPTHA